MVMGPGIGDAKADRDYMAAAPSVAIANSVGA
jgi:hypothetical protein